MAEDWSPQEVAATVVDYFAMLQHELRGESYSKAEHNRRLRSLLNNRSPGAIEFKHANISAVLIQLGFPYIDGYKPRSNYQELLKTEVASRLAGDISLHKTAEVIVDAPASTISPAPSLADVIVDAPTREREALQYERRSTPPPPRLGVNYLEREAKNRSLGLAGELFALEVEHRRLWDDGKKQLAERLEHVSQTKGDGLGYDILSFERDGRERYIEVKTTAFGQMTPFYASRGEVAMSDAYPSQFSLYRVFKFRESPTFHARWLAEGVVRPRRHVVRGVAALTGTRASREPLLE